MDVNLVNFWGVRWVIGLWLKWHRRNPSEVFDYLTTQRDTLYSHVEKLKESEQGLLSKGKSSISEQEKRRLARQILLLRKDLARFEIQIQMTNNQIEILNKQQHDAAVAASIVPELPTEDELVTGATDAEMAVEELQKLSLVNGMSTDILKVSDEEQKILDEFGYEDEKPISVTKTDAVNTEKQPKEKIRTGYSKTGEVDFAVSE